MFSTKTSGRNSLAACNFQNKDVAALARDEYDLASLQAVLSLLRSKGTLRLMRYTSGGASAVTPLDFSLVEKAVDGLLINHWDRDSVLQAVAELMVSLDPQFFGDLQIGSEQWKSGILASLRHHYAYAWRFAKVIDGRVSTDERPHIRYNPAGLFDLVDPWGHAQNDSLAAVLFFTHYAINRGYLDYEDAQVKELVDAFTALLHCLMWKVEVWKDDGDHGAWEDMKAVHTSSIEIVVMALREQLTFLEARGGKVRWHGKWDDFGVDRDYDCTSKGTRELIHNCEQTLKAVLPNEYVKTRHGDVTRSVDLAQVNGLFLAALVGGPLLDDEMALKVIDNIEATLMGHIGIARYEGDVWDGRVNRARMPLAQWCHGSPMLSYIFGEMYRRTGNEEFYNRQLHHFNRGLAHVNRRWHVPEAYITHPKNGVWISDENESLAWAQAMTICSFAGMKASIEYRASRVSTEAPASSAA
jgi:hypothetical protein